MSKQFIQNMFGWLDAVTADPAISPAAFRVAYAISRYINRASGQAWPTQETLSSETRMTRRWVQKCIEALVEHGHLLVTAGNGRGLCSTYEMVLHGAPVRGVETDERANPRSPYQASKKANGSSPFGQEKGEPRFAFIDEERANHSSEKGEPQFRKGRTTVRTELLEEPFEEPFERESIRKPASKNESDAREKKPLKRSPNETDERFEEFWRVYPKHVAKPAARQAWAAALKGGADPLAIIAGAMRYAAEQSGKDPQFIKHPATFLRNECWLDDPAQRPEAFAPAQGGGGGPRRRMSAVEMAFALNGGSEKE